MMYKAILQLTCTIHKNTTTGIVPGYNTLNQAIATFDGTTEADCQRQIDEFILKNGMAVLEKRVKP